MQLDSAWANQAGACGDKLRQPLVGVLPRFRGEPAGWGIARSALLREGSGLE